MSNAQSEAQRVKLSFGRSAKDYAKHGRLQKEVSQYLVHVFVPPDGGSPDGGSPDEGLPEAGSPGAGSAPRILDVGCGTGFTSVEIQAKWRDASLSAIDIAPEMAAQTKIAGIKNVAAGDAARLPFKASSFDLVISSLAFQWISHDERLFPAIARLLAPGGRLYFSTLGPGTLSELQQAYDQASRECTGKPALFRPMMGEDNLLELMARAGFVERFTMFKTMVRSYPSVQTLFKTLKGVGASMPGRPDNPPRRDVLKKTVEIYSSGNDPVEATYEVLYVSGRLA